MEEYYTEEELKDLSTNMPNIYKLMTTNIDDIKSNRHNKTSINVLQSIKDKIEDNIVETTDSINFLSGNIVASKMIENNELSNMMTNIFTDTKVKVYVYISSDINAYTMPGINIMSSPFLQKMQNILNSFVLRMIAFLSSIYSAFYLSVTNLFFLFLDVLEQCINGIDSHISEGSTTLVQYNPTTKKITISQKEVSIFVSSNLIKYINNDKELTAILLHEVGHNVKLCYSIVENLLNVGWISSVIISCYYYIKVLNMSIFDKEVQSTYDKALLLTISSIFILIFSMFIAAYLSRKQEIYSDEFAIKCGYGKYLYSAINKLHILSDELSQSNKKIEAKEKYSKYEKMLESVSSILRYLHRYPEQEERERMIIDKTNSYNISNKNIDRSSNI